MRSWEYNRFGVLMGASSLASCPRWPSLRGYSWPMITLFSLQGDFCATAMHPMRFHPTAQEVRSDGLAVDGQVHGLSDFFLHKGDSGIELVRRGKVHPPKLPLVLDG